MVEIVKQWLRKNHLIANVIVIYFLVCFILLPFFYYSINPDGISYINIAYKYYVGQWGMAVNGYWSPLLSWLMVPFLALGLGGIAAAHLAMIVSGLLTLVASDRLIRLLKIEEWMRAMLLLIFVFVVTVAAFAFITPDLLGVGIILLYFSRLFSKPYQTSRWAALQTGLIGAMAYLARSYHWWFFVIHFTLFSFIFHRYCRKQFKKVTVWGQFWRGMAVFLVISGIWVGLISLRYHYLTIGTAGEFNHELMGPQVNIYPNVVSGLRPPPDNLSTSFWDDPSNVVIKQWSPVGSISNFVHQSWLVVWNANRAIGFLQYMFPLAMAVFLIIVLLWQTKTRVDPLVNWLMLSLTIYGAGYLPLIVEERYLWLINMGLIIVCAWLIVRFVPPERQRSKLTLAIMLIFFVLAVRYPLEIRHMDNGKAMYGLAQSIPSHLGGQRQRIASLGNPVVTASLAYFNRQAYFGEPVTDSSGDGILRQLNDNKIQYFYVWGDWIEKLRLYQIYPDVSDGSVPNLRIYQL